MSTIFIQAVEKSLKVFFTKGKAEESISVERMGQLVERPGKKKIGFLMEMLSLHSMTLSCQEDQHVMYVVEQALRGHSNADLACEICRLIQFHNPNEWWHGSLEYQDRTTILRRL
jgi:hypothetical protein